MHRQDLSVICDGSRLSGGAWTPDDPRGLVVLLHGIPSVAPPDPTDTGYEGFAHMVAERGWITAWADMRGARKSQGFFSIEGWVRDARAIVDAARSVEGAASLPIALVGSSTGGAVAAEVIRRGAPADALALLGTPAAWGSFASNPRAGAKRIIEDAGMPLAPEAMEDPTSWAAEFDSVEAESAIVGVKVPTLILHGTDDSVVPVDHAKRIAERARSAELRILEGAEHQLRRDPNAIEILLEWLDRILA
ncbi:MAG TPA: alpha/beta hydrolase [Actinomycetota bacterium]|nr:alpha/beta hydrolase [Actinomycetota bacterium]